MKTILYCALLLFGSNAIANEWPDDTLIPCPTNAAACLAYNKVLVTQHLAFGNIKCPAWSPELENCRAAAQRKRFDAITKVGFAYFKVSTSADLKAARLAVLPPPPDISEPLTAKRK